MGDERSRFGFIQPAVAAHAIATIRINGLSLLERQHHIGRGQPSRHEDQNNDHFSYISTDEPVVSPANFAVFPDRQLQVHRIQ